MYAGRSTAIITIKATATTTAAAVCLLLIVATATWIEPATAMSLDRLAVERNELATAAAAANGDTADTADTEEAAALSQPTLEQPAATSDVVVDDMKLQALPAASGADMYMLVPETVASQLHDAAEPVNQNTIEADPEPEPEAEAEAEAESEAQAAPAAETDMLMLESDSMPAMQLLELPSDITVAEVANDEQVADQTVLQELPATEQLMPVMEAMPELIVEHVVEQEQPVIEEQTAAKLEEQPEQPEQQHSQEEAQLEDAAEVAEAVTEAAQPILADEQEAQANEAAATEASIADIVADAIDAVEKQIEQAVAEEEQQQAALPAAAADSAAIVEQEKVTEVPTELAADNEVDSTDATPLFSELAAGVEEALTAAVDNMLPEELQDEQQEQTMELQRVEQAAVEPAAEEPAAEATAVEQEEAAVEATAVEEAAVEEAAVEEAAAIEPAKEATAAIEPTVEAAAAIEPTVELAAPVEPAAEEPAAEEAAAEEAAAEEPAAAKPTAVEPESIIAADETIAEPSQAETETEAEAEAGSDHVAEISADDEVQPAAEAAVEPAVAATQSMSIVEQPSLLTTIIGAPAAAEEAVVAPAPAEPDQEAIVAPAVAEPEQQTVVAPAVVAATVAAAPTEVIDSVLNYVNASFMQQPQEELQKLDAPVDVAQAGNLRRYDGAQVWRIVVQTDKDKRLADELQSKYDGQLWKEVKQEVDYLLKPQVLAAAERHIRAANLSRIVLIDNLQHVIEVENPPAEKIAELQNRKGHRLTWQAYHRLEDIHGFIDYMAKTYPDICSTETIGYSVEKRPLKILKISNGNPANPAIWIDGGMHAREWISPATVTYIANQLIEGWEEQPDYIRNITWYMHAVSNPDGYEYSHTTDRLWRKNMRAHGRQCPGVDLNRNFGYKWGGKGTSASPCSQTYRGSKAFSEPETFYISKFISSFPRNTFQAYLSFHSYGQYILYPWGYDYQLTHDRADLDRVARQAGTSITKSTGVKYTVGAAATTLYPAAGGSDDWAKGIAGIKYAYTIEMGDTGRYGFVLPASFIQYNGKDGYTFVDTVARAIAAGDKQQRRRRS